MICNPDRTTSPSSTTYIAAHQILPQRFANQIYPRLFKGSGRYPLLSPPAKAPTAVIFCAVFGNVEQWVLLQQQDSSPHR